MIDSESLILTIPSPYGLLYAIKKAFPVYSKNCCDTLRRNGALVFAYECYVLFPICARCFSLKNSAVKFFSKTQLNDSAYFIHTESGILLFGIRLYYPLPKSFRNRQIYSGRLWIAPNRIEGSPQSPQLIQRSFAILEKCA